MFSFWNIRRPRNGKIRQFDIRADRITGDHHVAFAVECKNIRANHPLLLSAVRRTQNEAFHENICFDPGLDMARIERLTGRNSAYAVGEMVGKKTDQVGRDDKGLLFSDDSATFDKLNQAVNSCKDLVHRWTAKRDPPYTRVVVPVLVVLDGVLWQVDYSSDGQTVVSPRTVSNATLFLGYTWSAKRRDGVQVDYCLSHLEIVTLDGLRDRIESLLYLLA